MTDENRNQPDGEEVRDDMAAAGAADAPAAGRGEATPEPSAAEADAAAGEAPAAADADAINVDELPTITDEDLRDLLNEAMGASTTDGESDATAAPEAAEAAGAAQQDYLEDLRRVTAEYANYRRRTDREKAELRVHATASVVKLLLPVFDDLARARKAGDLEDGTAMRVIADKLQAAIEKMGVEAYGEAGEVFNPTIHEAIAQLPNPAVEVETIADVVELGYRIGDVELRPAKVAVFVPAE